MIRFVTSLACPAGNPAGRVESAMRAGAGAAGAWS